MNAKRTMRSRGRGSIVFAVVAALLLGVATLADDFEDPIDPGPPPPEGAGFGGFMLDTTDVEGFAIDEREAVEPQLTALLVMGELDVQTDETLEVSTTPTFDCSVQLPDESP